MKRVLAVCCMAAGTIVLSTCGDDVTPPSYAAALTIRRFAGDNQFVAAGAVTQPLMVVVTDQNGRAASNVTVRWRVQGPASEEETFERTTDVSGVADLVIALSAYAGTYVVTASLVAPFTGSVSFEVVAHVQGATQLAELPINRSPVDTVRAILQPYRVMALDHRHRPVAGVVVQWRFAAGGGSLQPTESVTDANGIAQSVHAVGDHTGVARAWAEVAGLQGSPVSFSTTLNAGQPVSFRKRSGDDQFGATGNESRLLSVAVLDAYGNGVRGQPVAWTVSDGDGVLTMAENATSNIGVANAAYRWGQREGAHTVTATAGGLTQAAPLTFTVTAFSGVIVNMYNYSSMYYYGPLDSGVFVPPFVVVNAGFKVTWVWPCQNCTDLLHKVVFENDPGDAHSSPAQYAGIFTRTFTIKGSYRFRCIYHSTDFTSGMVGELVVTD